MISEVIIFQRKFKKTLRRSAKMQILADIGKNFIYQICDDQWSYNFSKKTLRRSAKMQILADHRHFLQSNQLFIIHVNYLRAITSRLSTRVFSFLFSPFPLLSTKLSTTKTIFLSRWRQWKLPKNNLLFSTHARHNKYSTKVFSVANEFSLQRFRAC